MEDLLFTYGVNVVFSGHVSFTICPTFPYTRNNESNFVKLNRT